MPGHPGCLFLNYAWSHRVDKARRTQLIEAIRNSIQFNINLVGQIKEWIEKPNGTPFFNVDVELLASTTSLKYELLNNIPLCTELDRLLFEFRHLSRKVDLLLGLEFNPSSRMAISDPKGSMYNILCPRLTESLKSHIVQIEAALKKVEEHFR